MKMDAYMHAKEFRTNIEHNDILESTTYILRNGFYLDGGTLNVPQWVELVRFMCRVYVVVAK